MSDLPSLCDKGPPSTSLCGFVRVLKKMLGTLGATVNSLLASNNSPSAANSNALSSNTCDRIETFGAESTSMRKGVKGGTQISHDKPSDLAAVNATRKPARSSTNIGLTTFCADALSRATAPNATVAEP